MHVSSDRCRSTGAYVLGTWRRYQGSPKWVKPVFLQVFTLPKVSSKTKLKLTAVEGSRVRRVGLAWFGSSRTEEYGESGLVVLTNLGELHVLSLPHIKMQVHYSCIRREDISGIASCVFTKHGQGTGAQAGPGYSPTSVSVRHLVPYMTPRCFIWRPIANWYLSITRMNLFHVIVWRSFGNLRLWLGGGAVTLSVHHGDSSHSFMVERLRACGPTCFFSCTEEWASRTLCSSQKFEHSSLRTDIAIFRVLTQENRWHNFPPVIVF